MKATPAMVPEHRVRLERIRLGINRTSGRSALPKWMEQNLRDPKRLDQSWSFLHHEWQRGILETESPHLAIKKSSQVGASELSARMALGFMSLLPGSHIIYSLMTSSYALKFSAGRIAPAIEASPLLRRMLNREVDSAAMKQIGNSYLYLVGAQRQNQAISIPCRAVIRDEVNFSDPVTLTSLLSRLTHNAPGEEILVDFSTPTVPGYGIDVTFNEGTQRVYMVYHPRCGNWVEVDPALDIVLPGWDETLLSLTKADLVDSRIDPKKSFVKCRCCGNEITRENLIDPLLRAWVPKYPGRETDSFYVSPLDCSYYNTTEKIIRGVKLYSNSSSWIQFGLGHSHTPAGAAINPEVLDASCTGTQSPPANGGQSAAMYGTSLGLDVGKTCHLTVLVEQEGKYVVHWLERIRQKIRGDGTDEVSETVFERQEQYGVTMATVDGGPDITLAAKVIQGSGYGRAWACFFARTHKGTEFFVKREVDQVVTVARTVAIDELVKDINGGRFVFPKNSPELELFKDHLKKLRRITRASESTGDMVAAWVSEDSEDHFFFSLLYAYTSLKMQEAGASAGMGVSPSRLVTKTRMPNGVKVRDQWSRTTGPIFRAGI